MRTATLTVPMELTPDFARELSDLNLDNCIVGATDDDSVIVEINYEKGEESSVTSLERQLAKWCEELEEEDEESENDD